MQCSVTRTMRKIEMHRSDQCLYNAHKDMTMQRNSIQCIHTGKFNLLFNCSDGIGQNSGRRFSRGFCIICITSWLRQQRKQKGKLDDDHNTSSRVFWQRSRWGCRWWWWWWVSSMKWGEWRVWNLLIPLPRYQRHPTPTVLNFQCIRLLYFALQNVFRTNNTRQFHLLQWICA